MSVLERVHLDRFVGTPDRNGRSILEKEISRLLIRAPQVLDTDGKFMRVRAFAVPASAAERWLERPRVSDERMPPQEFEDASRTIPPWHRHQLFNYDEATFHPTASFVLSSKPSGIFGEVLSAQLSLLPDKRSEIWVYNLTLGRNPTLSSWVQSSDSNNKRGEQSIRAGESDITAFSGFLKHSQAAKTS